MLFGMKARRGGNLLEDPRHRSLEGAGRVDVLDAAAAPAHQVVVMFGQLFGQLEPGLAVGARDAAQDTGLLEHAEVAVQRTDGALATRRQLSRRQWPTRSDEGVDQGATVARVSLVEPPQPARHRRVDVS